MESKKDQKILYATGSQNGHKGDKYKYNNHFPKSNKYKARKMNSREATAEKKEQRNKKI